MKSKEELNESGEETNETKQEINETGDNRKFRIRLYVIIAILFVLIAVISIYFLGVIYYKNRFFPCTYINNISCDGRDILELEDDLQRQLLESYTLIVTGRDSNSLEPNTIIGEISGSDIDLQYSNIGNAVKSLIEMQNQWEWVSTWLNRDIRSISIMDNISYNEEKLEEIVLQWDALQEENFVAPADAYIGEYSEQEGEYLIVSETKGTELEIDGVLERVKVGIVGREKLIDLDEGGYYREASVTASDARLMASVEKVNTWLDSRISYDWNGNIVLVDAGTLSDWIIKDKNRFTLDKKAIKEFISENASKYDTYGKYKEFTTVLGETITLRSPNYGWKTDVSAETEELVKLISKGSVVSREPLYSVRARQKGNNDVGRFYIEADLTRQHLYVIEKGNIVFESDFVSGTLISTPDCISPEGIFGLSYKTTNAVLRGANYASHVDYWMPFYGNYGMHDASWRTNFGGSIFREHGSHGCINLPLEAAKTIYQYVDQGSPIICYYHQHDPYLQLDQPVEEVVEYTDEQLALEHEPTF